MCVHVYVCLTHSYFRQCSSVATQNSQNFQTISQSIFEAHPRCDITCTGTPFIFCPNSDIFNQNCRPILCNLHIMKQQPLKVSLSMLCASQRVDSYKQIEPQVSHNGLESGKLYRSDVQNTFGRNIYSMGIHGKKNCAGFLT